MSKLIDLTGQHFGYWKVIERSANTKGGQTAWLCECKCGKRKIIQASNLRNHSSKSCGCIRKEELSQRNIRHGMAGTRLYGIWNNMIQRTTNANNPRYCDYGGRGIEVCKEWKEDFEVFEKWAIENGYAENLTIDRKDNDKGYCPDNCRWATKKEQNLNTRQNHYLTFNGETKSLAEWADVTGIKRRILSDRINKLGWSAEKALTTKVRVQNKKQP